MTDVASNHHTAATAARMGDYVDEPIAKKQKQDDPVLEFGKAGQRYKDLMTHQKLALFDHVAAQHAVKGITLEMALKPTCMSRSVFYEMKTHIGTIRRVLETDPQQQYFCEPLKRILPKDVDNSANTMEQEVASNETQRLAMVQNDADLIFTRNAALVSRVLLKDIKLPHNSIVVDLTNGLGQFTANVKQWYTVVAVDKYKNCNLQPDDFAEVLSYKCSKFVQLLGKRGVHVVIYDPPYQTMIGGYNLHNSNWEKSQSRVNFNDRYGVSFPYTTTMIHCFYLKGFQLAEQLLEPEGFLMVKLMLTNGHDDLRQAVLILADYCGFKHDGDAYKVKSSNGDPSYLYVFVRRTSKDITFADLYQGDQAHLHHEQIKMNVQLRAGEDYKKAGRKLVKKAQEWIGYFEKLSLALTDKQLNQAVKDISPEITNGVSRYETNEEKYNSTFDEGAEIRPNSWEELQTRCLEVNADLTAIITMTGLLFEQLLKAKRIDVVHGSFKDKKNLEKETIGANLWYGRKATEASLKMSFASELNAKQTSRNEICRYK
eukprot:scaffold18417_cov79-Skeletonema_dohrnii-CCMP3373.AAC.3